MQPADLRERQPGKGWERLEAIMAVLRSPGGCPWDREQTLESLKKYLIEEAYELYEAIDENDPAHHLEELGDVLLQIVFQTQVRREEGQFCLDDVAQGIADKMVRRHPHVFGAVEVKDAAEVTRNWEAIKRRERGEDAQAAPRSPLAGIPAALPALQRAQRIQTRSARAGFDWSNWQQARDKVAEETTELDEAIAADDREAIAAELGDLLFALSSLARRFEIDAEDALRGATRRFEKRFNLVAEMARLQGRDLQGMPVEELVQRWQTAKEILAPEPPPDDDNGRN